MLILALLFLVLNKRKTSDSFNGTFNTIILITFLILDVELMAIKIAGILSIKALQILRGKIGNNKLFVISTLEPQFKSSLNTASIGTSTPIFIR